MRRASTRPSSRRAGRPGAMTAAAAPSSGARSSTSPPAASPSACARPVSEAPRARLRCPRIHLEDAHVVAEVLGAAAALLASRHSSQVSAGTPPCRHGSRPRRCRRRGGRRGSASPGRRQRSARTWCNPASIAGASSAGGVDGLRRAPDRATNAELRARERADERQALAEGAARVEVGGEGDRRARVDERAVRAASAGRGRARSPGAARRRRRSPRAPRRPRRPSPRGGRPTARRARSRAGSRPLSVNWSPWRRSARPGVAAHASR